MLNCSADSNKNMAVAEIYRFFDVITAVVDEYNVVTHSGSVVDKISYEVTLFWLVWRY